MNKTQMIDFLESRFNKCTDDLLEMCQIYLEDSCEDTFEDYYQEFRHVIGASKVMNGVSKLVLFFDEYPDYVFKIPLRGYLRIPEEEEDEYSFAAQRDELCISYDRNEVSCYSDASHCGKYPVMPDDYCETEEYLYGLASKAKVASMFAKTIYLGNIVGVDVYVSNRIAHEYDDCKSRHTSKYNKERARAIFAKSNHKYNKYAELYPDDLAMFICDYGINAAKRLIDFVNENDVTDFHTGNFGIDESGRIKIIDYSGFEDSTVFE